MQECINIRKGVVSEILGTIKLPKQVFHMGLEMGQNPDGGILTAPVKEKQIIW